MIEDVSIKFKKMSTDLQTITTTQKHQPTFTEAVIQELSWDKSFKFLDWWSPKVSIILSWCFWAKLVIEQFYSYHRISRSNLFIYILTI